MPVVVRSRLYIVNRYSGSSYSYTNSTGASATFTFNGTSVEIFGSKRANHGLYQVKVDDTEYPPISGNATEPGEFQQALFSVNDLSFGLHQVTLTNQENAFVDIDFVRVVISKPELTVEIDVTCQCRSPGKHQLDQMANNSTLTLSKTQTLRSPIYPMDLSGQKPQTIWEHILVVPDSKYTLTDVLQPSLTLVLQCYQHLRRRLLLYIQSELSGFFCRAHTNIVLRVRFEAKTENEASNTQCAISGDGVSLVGPVGPNGGSYTVQVDGGPTKNYTTNNQFYTPHSMLYHADSLGPGQHRLKLSYMSTSPDQVFSIDYANVYSASSSRTT
jgi:hypothetical protein